MKDTTILNQDISDLEITDLVTTDLVTKANEVKLLKDLIANDASTGTDDSYTETLLLPDVDSESDEGNDASDNNWFDLDIDMSLFGNLIAIDIDDDEFNVSFGDKLLLNLDF